VGSESSTWEVQQGQLTLTALTSCSDGWWRGSDGKEQSAAVELDGEVTGARMEGAAKPIGTGEQWVSL
jgi:uncharacterized protein YhdP